MKNFARGLLLALITLLTACTSGPQLKDYPQNQSERPYTLPSGVATWTTDIWASLKHRNDATAFVLAPNPFNWQMALSDNWTLGFHPLPLSISRQIFRTPDLVFGSSFGMGFAYVSDFGMVYIPEARIHQRQRFSERLYLILEPQALVYAAFKGRTPRAWRAGSDIEVRVQATDTFYVQGGLGIYYSENDLTLVFDEDTVNASPNDYFTIPFMIRTGWSFDRQWDLNVSYSLYALGYENHYVRQTLGVKLVHFW